MPILNIDHNKMQTGSYSLNRGKLRRQLSGAIPSDEPHYGPERANETMLRFLGWVTLLALVICFIVNGLLPQLEMFITDGSTPLKARFRLILVVLALTSFLITRCFRKNPIGNAHIVWAVFMCVDFALLYTASGYNALDILDSFRVTLVPLLLFGFMLSTPLALKQRSVLAFGAVIFTACITMSAWQYVTNDTVLPTRSQDGAFVVPSYVFFDRMRAFSFFGSGLDAGLFYCIPAAVGVLLMLIKRKPILGGLVLLLSIFGSYASFTRLAILGIAASILSAITLWRAPLSRATRVLPLGWTLAAVVTIGLASAVNESPSRTGFSSTTTLQERLSGWRFCTGKYLSGNPVEILFGTGMSEYVDSEMAKPSPAAAPVLIDNGYLQILLNSGLLSLVIFIFYYMKAWHSLYLKATTEQSVFGLAAAAVFSTTPLITAINDIPIGLFALFTIAMMIEREERDQVTMRTSRSLRLA